MLITHIPPFIVLLCYYFTPIIASVGCLRWAEAKYTAAECRAAVNLIPDGIINFDGKESKPLNFYLPPTAHQHTYHLLPVWRAGSCTVSVERHMPITRHNQQRPRPQRSPPQLAASALYLKVWPAVKEVAEQIMKECFSDTLPGNAGYAIVSVDVYGQQFEYIVVVGDSFHALPEKSGPFSLATNPGDERPPTHHLHAADKVAGNVGPPPSQ